MESLYLLIPLSIALVVLIIGVLWWAVRAGQFDDLEGPAHAILLDDDSKPAPTDSTIVDPHQKVEKP